MFPRGGGSELFFLLICPCNSPSAPHHFEAESAEKSNHLGLGLGGLEFGKFLGIYFYFVGLVGRPQEP